MFAETLHDFLQEAPAVSSVLLRVDPDRSSELDARLKRLPAVLTVTRRAQIIQSFQDQSGGMLLTTSLVIALFAATITVGVVYNNARAALSTRARDLASLRVLGFTRREVSAVLLGEIAVPVLLAIPLGLVAGRGLVALLASTADPEAYRMPLLLTPRTYAFAALVTLVSALASALLVRRRIDQLDLVSVLKARE
jgi:putative ABC transport system permease protein